MTNSSWSNNPYAPQITYDVYFAEKTNFAGTVIGGMFYGVIVVLFFQCMKALFNHTNRRRYGGVKWRLVIYTVIMFSFATVFTGMGTDIQSISFIDNRNFPGVGDTIPPGPLGYQLYIYSKPISIVPNTAFLLMNWMADGLLLYRCYIVYGMSLWIVALPCLMYLSSVAMGTTFLYQVSRPGSNNWNPAAINFGLPYFSISIGLNTVLTLMIVARLVMHSRSVRIIATSTGATRLYSTIITMLVESSAFYAVNSILFIGSWAAGSHIADVFSATLAGAQVISPLLIIRRVANHSALTSDSVATGHVTSFKFNSAGETTTGVGTIPSGYPLGETDKYRKSSNELAVGVDTTIEFRDDV